MLKKVKNLAWLNLLCPLDSSIKLNLSADLADKVTQLLESLDLSEEIELFVDWTTLASQLNVDLDPSRAGNFLIDVENIKVLEILQGAKA